MISKTHKNIAERAYALWEHAGRPHGKALEHWLQAEAELADAGPLVADVVEDEGHKVRAAKTTKSPRKPAKPSARKRANNKAASSEKRSSRKR